MPAATLLPDRTRTFGRGETALEHPVDALGRIRYRAKVTGASITRSDGESEPIGFKGTAIVFNSRTWIGGRSWGYWEQIAPEAVTKTLKEADIRFLQNHDPNLLLARNKAGTLRLNPTDSGLEVDADMAPVSYAQDLAVLLERGDISQMSFAFDPVAWKREEVDNGDELITFTEIRLWDVSVVTYPAYEDTDASLRMAAFDALCRSNNLEADAVLRAFAAGDELPTISTDPAPAETTRTETSEPAESTRETSPPAEPTGTQAIHPNALRMNAQRMASLKEI
jgi:HK97 family phage prohead protease